MKGFLNDLYRQLYLIVGKNKIKSAICILEPHNTYGPSLILTIFWSHKFWLQFWEALNLYIVNSGWDRAKPKTYIFKIFCKNIGN